MTIARLPGQALARLADLDREQWLALRRGGIGSSDAAAIAGVDPWRSAYAAYAEKIADEWPDEDNAAMLWGRKLEPLVADHFAEETGAALEAPTSMYVHPDRPWMRASPDRLRIDRDGNPIGVLEVKTTGYAPAWADGPPNQVKIQAQHQLEVLGLAEADIAVLIGGRDYRAFHMPYDAELVGYLVEIEAEFWRRVEERDPPPVDGSRSSSEAIRRLHAHVETGTERLLDAEACRLVEELRNTKALRADLEGQEAELENRLKVALGDAETGIDADGERLVTWKAVTSHRIDTKALRDAYPQIAAQLDTETTSRRFLLTKRGA
jgi:putative phage-type endonuclease